MGVTASCPRTAGRRRRTSVRSRGARSRLPGPAMPRDRARHWRGRLHTPATPRDCAPRRGQCTLTPPGHCASAGSLQPRERAPAWRPWRHAWRPPSFFSRCTRHPERARTIVRLPAPVRGPPLQRAGTSNAHTLSPCTPPGWRPPMAMLTWRGPCCLDAHYACPACGWASTARYTSRLGDCARSPDICCDHC